MSIAVAKRTVLRALFALLSLFGPFAVAFGQLAPGAAVSLAVSLDAAREAHERGAALLIDIREPEEHARGVAAGARLLPMSQLRQRLAEVPLDSTTPVLLICNTQNRSAATLRALRSHGYAHVRYVNGGMSEWVKRGWPVVMPPPGSTLAR